MLDAEDLLASSLVRNVLSPEEIQRAEEDEDWLNYRIEEEGEKVFTLSWESSMPGTCGASWIIRWRGLYFFRSSDLDPDGPFPTLDAALSIEYLSQFASFHQIDSGAIPRNEIVHFVEERCQGEVGEDICINGDRYELTAGGLVLREVSEEE